MSIKSLASIIGAAALLGMGAPPDRSFKYENVMARRRKRLQKQEQKQHDGNKLTRAKKRGKKLFRV